MVPSFGFLPLNWVIALTTDSSSMVKPSFTVRTSFGGPGFGSFRVIIRSKMFFSEEPIRFRSAIERPLSTEVLELTPIIPMSTCPRSSKQLYSLHLRLKGLEIRREIVEQHVLDSLVVSIPACHAEGRGSITFR